MNNLKSHVELCIDKWIDSHRVYLIFKIYDRDASFDEDNQRNVLTMYLNQSSDLLSNSFRYNLAELKQRLDKFIKDLGYLDEGCYKEVMDRLEEIFKDEMVKGRIIGLSMDVLDDEDWEQALEYFHTKLTNSDYIQLRSVNDISNKIYDQELLKSEYFKNFSEHKFLGIKIYTDSYEIIYNHVKAIDMITNGHIPLYHEPLINVDEKINMDNAFNEDNRLVDFERSEAMENNDQTQDIEIL